MATQVSLDPISILREKVDAANVLGRKIQAAKSDSTAAVEAIVTSSDDEKIVAYRAAKAKIEEQIETLQAKLVNGAANIREHAASLVPAVEEGFDLDVALKEFAGLRKDVTATRGALALFLPEDQIKALMEENGITEVISIKGTGSAKGTTGIKRPRISAATMDGKRIYSDKDETKVDFTGLAKAAGSDANTLKAAAFAAAETEDLNSLAEGTVVNFTVGDHKFSVTVSGEKPGRKPAEKVETPAE